MANTQPVAEPVTSSSTTENMVEGINELKVDEGKPTDVVENSQGGPTEESEEGESTLARLHRLCATGDVLGVRAILGQSLELLESIGECSPLSTLGYLQSLVVHCAASMRGRLGQSYEDTCQKINKRRRQLLAEGQKTHWQCSCGRLQHS